MVVLTDRFAQMDPCLTTYWRWQAVEWLDTHKRKRSIPVDQDILSVAKHFRNKTPKADNIHQAVLREFKADSVLRWELESRVLCGESTAKIASSLDVSVEFVELFEYLFFDVRRFSRASDWVLKAAIGGRPLRCFKDGDFRFLLNHFAYHAGPVIAELVRTEARRIVHKKRRVVVYDLIAKASELPLMMKAAISLNVIPRDQISHDWFIRVLIDNPWLLKSNHQQASDAKRQKLMQAIIRRGRGSLRGTAFKPLKPLDLPVESDLRNRLALANRDLLAELRQCLSA